MGQPVKIGPQNVALQNQARELPLAHHLDQTSLFEFLNMVRDGSGTDLLHFFQFAALHGVRLPADLLQDVIAARFGERAGDFGKLRIGQRSSPCGSHTPLNYYGILRRMSFLDNLENNLKALEGREERDPETLQRERARREAERNAALLRAPHAEDLKKSAFTNNLLGECRAAGRTHRVLVQFAWIGENLRLDAKTKRMELTPTPEGIVAVCSEDGKETARIPVNPAADDPAALARRWLES